MPVVPLLASTVALLRDRPGGMEVYLLEKSRSLEFAGGAYVFPGGTVDQEDRSPEWLFILAGMGLGTLHEKIPDSSAEEAQGYYIAAVRELFEEAGILLSSAEPDEEIRREARESLLRGKSFLKLCGEHRLAPDSQKLTYYAHWVTPEIYPIRFSARFFLAKLPEDQEPSPDGKEVLRGIWISPGEAVEKSNSGSLPLMTPTAVSLQELSHFTRADEAMSWGEKRTKIPRKPWVDEKGTIHLS